MIPPVLISCGLEFPWMSMKFIEFPWNSLNFHDFPSFLRATPPCQSRDTDRQLTVQHTEFIWQPVTASHVVRPPPGKQKHVVFIHRDHGLKQTLAQLIRMLLARFRLLAILRYSGSPHFEKMVPPMFLLRLNTPYTVTSMYTRLQMPYNHCFSWSP